jgi:4-methylaminobutanoate oxidase (formaldehyde-forming)
MQTHARVVIVGGGIAGASIAYHLAELGWRDVVVLEQGELISGTTSHAPGLVGQLRSSASLMRMLMYSASLYRTLSVDGGPGFLGEGSVRLASSKERWAQIRSQADFAGRVGLEAHLLTPQEVKRMVPLLVMNGVEGALFIPSDGSATAPILTQALIGKARERGVVFHPHTQVRRIDIANGAVKSVDTHAGRIATETLVVAAGIWSPALGRMAGVTLPLVPMHHQYVETAPLPELAQRVIPNLRDPDNLIYTRQRGQNLVLGGYERDPQLFRDDAIPETANPTVQSFHAEHFRPLAQAAAKRLPALAGATFVRQVNGLESFTIDGEFLLGPAPQVRGFWLACGFCAHGVSSAAGVGKVLAEWIVHGDPGLDLAAMELRRFQGRTLTLEAIREGARRVYGTYYDIPANT